MSGLQRTDLLIIGAGPFGLAMARYAQAHGIDHVAVGRSMAFWKDNMPEGMLLRSGFQWHLDSEEVLTFRRFLQIRGLSPDDLAPLAIDVYLDYARWFERSADTDVRDRRVKTLARDADGRFRAHFVDGTELSARCVLLALGFHAFKHVDDEFTAMLPPGRYSHTRDFVHMESQRGKRCLIIGGRQSAFEWAALLAEAGAAAVSIVHRHETPRFTPSDWSWVPGLLESTEADAGWFRSLPARERLAIEQRFWHEGRAKLEPWLAPRLRSPAIDVWANTRMVGCAQQAGGRLRISLDSGSNLEVDHVVLATGYKVDMDRLELLGEGIRGRMALQDGSPCLDTGFQSSVPGLYVTSLPAARDFGPFMGFTVAVPATTRIIGGALRAHLSS